MNSSILSTVPQSGATLRLPLSPLPQVEPARENSTPSPALNGEPAGLPAKKPGRPAVKWAALAGLALVIGAGSAKLGYDWWTVGRFLETTDDAYVGGDVTVIAPKVPGFIAQLAVRDNQAVHSGDLLVKLDDRDYLAALAKADAVVAMQQATLANLEATRHLQASVIAQARAEIGATDAEIVRAQDDQARYRNLLASGAVSTQSSQQADTSYQQAFAAGEKARAALETALRQLDVIATQKMQIQAALNQALADRELARLNVSYTELRAPVDGSVGNRSAQAGAYTTTGAQLISLVPARGLWIDANFKESQLQRIQPGEPVTVRVDLMPGRVLHGHVASLAPATGAQFSILPPENATGNFTKIVQRVAVRILLDDDPAALASLRPGLSVTAVVDSRAATGGAL